MKKKILGIMLIIAIMLLVIIPIAYASEEPVTIDISTLESKNIYITPTGYYRFGGDEISYTGTYKLTGSGDSIKIRNYSGSEVTFEISLDELEVTDPIFIMRK